MTVQYIVRRCLACTQAFLDLEFSHLYEFSAWSIKMLLGSLMATNKLMTWQIYQERSGNTLVKIRFGYHENGGPALPTDEIQNSNTFFKRKSDKQVRRDTERAKTHSDRITRSKVRSRTQHEKDKILPM